MEEEFSKTRSSCGILWGKKFTGSCQKDKDSNEERALDAGLAKQRRAK